MSQLKDLVIYGRSDKWLNWISISFAIWLRYLHFMWGMKGLICPIFYLLFTDPQNMTINRNSLPASDIYFCSPLLVFVNS